MSVDNHALYTAGQAEQILGETVALLQQLHAPSHDLSRLEFLLSHHFQDNPKGLSFRSLCCFGRTGVDVSLDMFNQLCILPKTDWQVRLSLGNDSNVKHVEPTLVDRDTREIYLLDLTALASKNIRAILNDILQNHPSSSTISAFLSSPSGLPLSWCTAILGLKGVEYQKHFQLPSNPILRHRITLCMDMALQKKRDNPYFKLFCAESGSFWNRPDDSLDINSIYLKTCSEFPTYLKELLASKATTLDKLAGVKPSTEYPEVTAIVEEGYARASTTGVESHDMFSPDGSTLAGTVFAMHNGCLSAEWVAAYLVDTDNNMFMTDMKAKLGNDKDRLMRIYSVHHTFDDPTWIQYGETKNVYMFLSQRASAAEEGWLTIASYIINLLVNCINDKLDGIPGSKQYKLERIQYDAGVVNVADPTVGSFAGHTDAKPGLVHPSVPGYSRFLLMVPTLAISNHCSLSSHISWYRRGDLKRTKTAKISQDFVVLHAQLVGVQDEFEHEVRNNVLTFQPATNGAPFSHCAMQGFLHHDKRSSRPQSFTSFSNQSSG
jgi:hypothetical protein